MFTCVLLKKLFRSCLRPRDAVELLRHASEKKLLTRLWSRHGVRHGVRQNLTHSYLECEDAQIKGVGVILAFTHK